jgi:hypothetical protein
MEKRPDFALENGGLRSICGSTDLMTICFVVATLATNHELSASAEFRKVEVRDDVLAVGSVDYHGGVVGGHILGSKLERDGCAD